MFQQKIAGNERALNIIRRDTGSVSKSTIVMNIKAETGVIVSKYTVYEYQHKLNLI